MADFGLFIGYGPPARGRERQSIKVFNEAMEYYTRLQQQGAIESFEAVMLQPHGGTSTASSCCAETTATSSQASSPATSSRG